jgi:hypothetical protein
MGDRGLFGLGPYVSWLACIVGACAWLRALRRFQDTQAGSISMFVLFSAPSGSHRGAPSLRYAVAFFWIPARLGITAYVSSCTTRKSLLRLALLLTCTGLSGPLIIPTKVRPR